MRRSKTFLLDQVKMKKWPSSIIHKGLPENQYYHSELQGNISFPSKEQVYRKLMALLDNGKKLLLDRLKLLLLLASQQKPQQPFAQERVTPGRKKMLAWNPCMNVAGFHYNTQLICTVKADSIKSAESPSPSLLMTCWICGRSLSLAEPWCL